MSGSADAGVRVPGPRTFLIVDGHPLGWLNYAVCLLLWLRAGLTWLRGAAAVPIDPRISGRLSWAALAAVLVTGLARIGWLLYSHQTYG